MTGMGYLSAENSMGFYLHPSIALTPDKRCLGVINSQTWVRTSIGTKQEKKNKPIEEKESYCWLRGYQADNEIALASPNTAVAKIANLLIIFILRVVYRREWA